MSVLYVYNQSLLDCNAQLIAQQCNYVSKKAKGLSQSIIDKYPYADFYSKRTTPSVPGTIRVVGNKQLEMRYICAMFAQMYPGKAKYNNDTTKYREIWFEKCLQEISKLKNLKSVAFPHGIGCGLAKGDWNVL